MDCQDYITESVERKKGQHLQREERGAIQHLKNAGYTNRAITVDNGSEFSAFSQVENWGCAVYFAHPYTSWERPQNERHNGLFRTFVPKGVSIEAFSAEYILVAADELNGRPRKKLGYRTPEELFDEFLDSVYAAEGCGSIAQDGSQRLPS